MVGTKAVSLAELMEWMLVGQRVAGLVVMKVDSMVGLMVGWKVARMVVLMVEKKVEPMD